MHVISQLAPKSGHFSETSLTLCEFAIIANQLNPLGDMCFYLPPFALITSFPFDSDTCRPYVG